jgi:hypothetical protein
MRSTGQLKKPPSRKAVHLIETFGDEHLQSPDRKGGVIARAIGYPSLTVGALKRAATKGNYVSLS